MIVNYPLLVFALSVVILSLAVELGEVLRRRIRSSKEEERDDFGVVLGANLTLLALLIGFSFSMAVSAGVAETVHIAAVRSVAGHSQNAAAMIAQNTSNTALGGCPKWHSITPPARAAARITTSRRSK